MALHRSRTNLGSVSSSHLGNVDPVTSSFFFSFSFSNYYFILFSAIKKQAPKNLLISLYFVIFLHHLQPQIEMPHLSEERHSHIGLAPMPVHFGDVLFEPF